MPIVIDHLIIGSGVAGATAAARLRELGTGTILLCGAEAQPPYKRPRLSKQYLRGEHTVEDMLVDTREGWEARGVGLSIGNAVVRLDTTRRTALLEDGTSIAYGNALLATGSVARPLAVPGWGGTGMHTLRTMQDAGRIREEIRPGSRVVVVGGSFNGCEAAASAAARGAEVTVVALESAPLERILGKYVGSHIERLFGDHGCTFLGGTSVDRIDPSEAGGVLVTTDGRELPFDVLVACVGAAPDLDLARASGLDLSDGGVACDSRMRTSANDLYAAGDIAAYDSPTLGRRVRLERFEAAWSQSRTAAANMLGAEQDHDDRTPFFHSELDDWFRLSVVGLNLSWDREVLVGDIESGSASVWYLQGDSLAATAVIGEDSGHLDLGRRVLRGELSAVEALALQTRALDILTPVERH
ncbi:MAG: FAD-dependent oxidoreductase [Microbacterium sp.]